MNKFTFILGVNGKILYSISEGDEKHQFTISENGTIMTAAPLDREEQSSYNLIVTASDMANDLNRRLTSSIQVLINFILFLYNHY